MDHLHRRLEALEQRTQTVERQLRWWRGMAGGLLVLAVLTWALPASTAPDATTAGRREPLADTLAALEPLRPLLRHLTIARDEEGRPEIRLTGANLRIVNGLGRTDCTDEWFEPIPDCPNGLGNLIVGYNEPRPEDLGFENVRTGSHNVVVGREHNFSRVGGLVVGRRNAILGDFASVSGGAANTASGDESAISGGISHTASGVNASVSGGTSNTASGDFAAVSGGIHNTASGYSSAVSGGGQNAASGAVAAVCGGSNGTASGDRATVSGGLENTASGGWASVTGGWRNTADGSATSITAGAENHTSGQGASISGGAQNSVRAQSFYATVSGGQGNEASGDWSIVSGGRNRTAEGDFDWVAGPFFADE